MRELKTTTSRCPECLTPVPAVVYEDDRGRVLMRKSCDIHGESTAVIAPDGRWYHHAVGRRETGCGSGCGCGGEPATGDPFEKLSTCVALIEIVDSCNLECPTCFASSPRSDEVDCRPFEEIVARIGGVVARKGFIDILQLSGGEPTLHPRFFDILSWCLANDRIGYVLINTNAVRIATDEPFRRRLASLRTANSFELYVQFDGVQEAGQRALRAADLREIRRRAIDEVGALGVPSTLAMVVTAETIDHLGDALRFGLGRRHCRGITFQPMFASGRTSGTLAAGTLHTADMIDAVTSQSEGLITEDDFTPLPCGDPNCHTIGYVVRGPDGPAGLGSLIDLGSLQSFLSDRVNYSLEDLVRCGCETEPLGEILKSFELSPDAPFRIFVKPFMDRFNFDQDRIDRCCTHVVRRDGSLDSFCRYYLHGGALSEVDVVPRGSVTIEGRAR
ncbi:MAG: radical SAM protein [Planctomycetota bacterium]